MDLSSLRVALFSGNYNYVRDGANLALNRLVRTLLDHGAHVRVYSPTVAGPAFPATGDLVSVASIPFPGRGEYRIALGLPRPARADLDAFAPNIVHVSAPDLLGRAAENYAQRRNLALIGSVHTRFDTYASYYRLSFLEPVIAAMMRRFYGRCDELVAPSESMLDLLRAEGFGDHLSLWARGVDHAIFNPERRDPSFRARHGIGDDELVVGFFGRIVMEKGLDVFARAVTLARQRGVRLRVLVVGDGPARDGFSRMLEGDAAAPAGPAAAGEGAVFTGFLQGAELAQAVASMDIFLNPSLTETFGNVTLEAMACGVAVIGARATGTDFLVIDGVTGRLVPPNDVEAFADAIARYASDDAARRAAGVAGAKRAREFGWDEVNLAVASVYFSVIARRSGSPAGAPATVSPSPRPV